MVLPSLDHMYKLTFSSGSMFANTIWEPPSNTAGITVVLYMYLKSQFCLINVLDKL